MLTIACAIGRHRLRKAHQFRDNTDRLVWETAQDMTEWRDPHTRMVGLGFSILLGLGLWAALVVGIAGAL